MQIRLKIEGMTCGGCRAAVERVLVATDCVENVSVDLASGSALVATHGAAGPESLIAAVENAGYEARVEHE